MNALKDAVCSFKDGDESAFSDIYNETYRKVSLSARSYLKNHADAEDIVQEIYIQVFNKIKTIQDENKSMAWILTLTRNACLNKLETLKRAEVTTFEPGDGDGPSLFEQERDERVYNSPEDSLLKKEKSNIIVELVSLLPLEQKDTVMLRYIEKKSLAEVAEITQATQSTVKSRLTYAKRKLKELVEEREERDGIRLRMGGLFIFAPFIVRYAYSTATLSAETATATIAGVEAALGVTVQTSAATAGQTAVLSAAVTPVTAVLGANAGVAAIASVAVVTCIGVGAAVVVQTNAADTPVPGVAETVVMQVAEEQVIVILVQERVSEEYTEYVPFVEVEFERGVAEVLDEQEDAGGPAVTPEPTPSPTPEPTPSPTPEPTPSPTPELTPSPMTVPTPELTPTPTPEPTPSLGGTLTRVRGPLGDWIDGITGCTVHGLTMPYAVGGCAYCGFIRSGNIWNCEVHGDMIMGVNNDRICPLC